ncbi:MAG: hypothetical protein LAP87_27970 [Acidobacteriia bacterium]|nr:hypothetical protein [Terriglobia bacterium]
MNDLQYFRFMLTTIAGLDSSPDAVKMVEDSLIQHFGLNDEEFAVVRAAGQQLKPLLQQLRQSSTSIAQGKVSLSAADSAALAALDTQREARIAALSNQILNSVRPATADRLRIPGQVLSRALNSAQGGK